MQAMGASVTQLPGAEILPAMENGVIEAFEFNNPTSDRRFGAQDVAKFYYVGSYHQASECLEIMFNKTKFDALAKEQQADPPSIAVAGRFRRRTCGRPGTSYSKDLQTLIDKHQRPGPPHAGVDLQSAARGMG